MKNLKHQTKSNIGIKSSHSALFYVTCGTTGFLLFVTILSGIILSNAHTHAVNDNHSNVSVIVNSACTITSGGGSYVKTIPPGTTEEIAGNGINVTCNDNNGYSLYAVGYSDNSYDTTKNTKMLAVAADEFIPTGTSGSGSYWAMKAEGSSDIGTTPTIDNGFSSYRTVPATHTRISYYPSATQGTTSNSVTTPSYQIHVASAQAAGTYTGKVKYTLVHPQDVDTAVPMQNWNGCSTLAIGSSTFLQDTRDGKFYNVIKYNDGKCWMTTNLDLAGGTALSSTDTDFDSTYTLPTTNGWTVSDGKLVMPASSTTGFDTDNYAYVFNSGNQSTNCSTPGCYSYYSWDAATVGSGRSITTGNTDAPYSICPKGWHLPNTRSGTDDTSDFRKLMVTLGGSATIETYNANTIPTGATMFGYLTGEPLNYLRAGYYTGSTFYYGGGVGRYWSATSYSVTGARDLNFTSTYVASAKNDYRRYGFSVRCIADQ